MHLLHNKCALCIEMHTEWKAVREGEKKKRNRRNKKSSIITDNEP